MRRPRSCSSRSSRRVTRCSTPAAAAASSSTPLRKRDLPVDYWGIDASQTLIDIGREELPRFGLEPERLRALRIGDLDGEVDHAVGINVLSNIEDFRRPLERCCASRASRSFLRESVAADRRRSTSSDKYLDRALS